MDLRRIGAAVCLIGGPVLLLASDLISVGMVDADRADQLAEVYQAQDRWFASTAVGLVAVTLAVGATLALVWRAGREGDPLAVIGGALGVIGLMAVAALIAFDMVLWLMTQPGNDPRAMTELANAFTDSSRILLVYLVSTAFFLGWLALAVALYRTRSAPAWVAIGLGVATVISAPGRIGAIEPLYLVGDVLVIATLGFLGLEELRGGDERSPATG